MAGRRGAADEVPDERDPWVDRDGLPHGAPPRRRRRWMLATLTGLLVVAVVGFGALMTGGYDAYPLSGCKGIGYAPVLLEDDGRALASPTPEAAVAKVSYDPMTGTPIAIDGWHQYRGRWVNDVDDDHYVVIDVREGPYGWVAGGDFWSCRHLPGPTLPV